jgi:DNA repair protein RecO (recombination protein O)
LRRDLARLQQATYCAALIEQPTEMESPIPRIFELFSGFLRHLSERETQARTVIAFELKLLTELGLKPDLERSSLTPGARMLLNKLLEADWTTVSRVTLSAAQITEARQFLHGFLIYHLGKGLPGRAAALRASSD